MINFLYTIIKQHIIVRKPSLKRIQLVIIRLFILISITYAIDQTMSSIKLIYIYINLIVGYSW